MSDITVTIISILIPLLGTTLGAGMVFFLNKEMSERLRGALLGFASGVMIAASVWSLLIPALEMVEDSSAPAWLPAATGFLAGMLFLLILDTYIPHLHIDTDTPEGVKSSKISRSIMLVLAVTLHNIPEGMAVGVAFAGMLSGKAEISAASAIVLSIGIALQNFPEGAIISMPLVGSGISKGKAFKYGFISGVVEPVAAFLTILLTSFVVPLLPFLLAFAAGAMIYVVVEELIPEAQSAEHSNIATIGVALGFTLMMVLDVALG